MSDTDLSDDDVMVADEPAHTPAQVTAQVTEPLPEVLDLLDEGTGGTYGLHIMDDGEPPAAGPVEPGPVLQLRILSGMHAGACAPLDGDAYLLGALDDCDFVLTDAGVQPHHARLSRTDGGWQLDWVAQEGGEPVLAPMRLESGKAVPMGPIVVAVDDALAPWPTLEQLVLVPHAPALEPQLPPPAQPVGESGQRARRRRLLPATALLAPLMSALMWFAWPAGSGQMPAAGDPGAGTADDPVAAAAPLAPGQPDMSQKQAIDAALKSAGLGGQAKVEHTGAGWLVHAPVMSETEGEALSAALSRIRPRPALRLTTESDLRDEVAPALARLAQEQRAALSLHPAGQGRFRIEGTMDSAAARDTLLAALARSFPHVRGWDNAVSTPQDAGMRLLAELRQQGWQASGEWGDGAMQITVQLHQRDVPHWERTLMAATQANPVPLRARLDIVQAGAAASAAPVAPVAPAAASAASTLPFTVRSVVGGDMPYVLLTNGEKLAHGAVSQGWRLSAVSVSQVVFENGARRAVLTR